jgi:DNA polymerase-3 subunit delta
MWNVELGIFFVQAIYFEFHTLHFSLKKSLTYKDIQAAFKKKNFAPIYFLHGDEPFYIDTIANYLEHKVLTEEQKSFNLTVLYGKEATHLHILDSARRYPIMADNQVIVIKEAQEMKDLMKLENYFKQPMPTTIVVIVYKYKKFDKRTKFAKALAADKNAVVFESKKLYENKIADWATNYLKENGYNLMSNASELVVEYLGTSLSKISNELDKLMINVPKGTQVTEKHIQDNIGISKDYNVFELQKALGSKKIEKSQRILNYFKANPKSGPMVMVVSSLYSFFSKVYIFHSVKGGSDNEIAAALGMRSSYFLQDYRVAAKNYNKPKTEEIISLLHEYDMKSKGVNRDNTTESELMRELIYRILH